MNREDEKWAIFWCDLLSPVIYEQIEPEAINRFLKARAKEQIRFPDGRLGSPSLKTLRRKLNRYRDGGFDVLARKKRCDRGKPRNCSKEAIDKAIELKKEQPYRSPRSINRFLEEMYAVCVPRSTLYRHLKNANATEISQIFERKNMASLVGSDSFINWIRDKFYLKKDHKEVSASSVLAPDIRDVALNNAPILLVFWSVFGVALRGTDNEYAPHNAP